MKLKQHNSLNFLTSEVPSIKGLLLRETPSCPQEHKTYPEICMPAVALLTYASTALAVLCELCSTMH